MLAGIGLVIVGLLVGVLLTLWLQRPEVPPPARLQEPVSLRPAPAEPEPSARPDSSGPDDVTEPQPLPEVADLARLNDLFKGVAQRVTPAVVFIQVEMNGEVLPRDWFHNFDKDGERLFRDRAPRQSVGSGVVLTADGYIVTNNHVVQDAEQILVTLSDKRQYRAQVVGTDPSTDLAVIKVDGAEGLAIADLADSDEVMVGEWVLAIGNPFRLTSTVTAGIVSALGRQVNIIEDAFGSEAFIQTDAAINPGNSGGALVNLKGELVGINTAIATESGSYEGYGFAVPSNLMERVAEDLIRFGEVQRGFLGVEIGTVSARDARRAGLDAVHGVRLGRITPGGAAARGGLEEDDIVLGINGTRVDAPNELQRTVARYRPGDELLLDVWREGRLRQFRVYLLGRDDPAYRDWFAQLQEEAPPVMPDLEAEEEPPTGDMREVEPWGFALRDLTPKEQRRFRLEAGAYIPYVQGGSAASEAGLPRDVVIDEIEGTAIASADEAVEVLRRADGPVLMRIRRSDGVAAFFEVEAEAR